MLENYDQRENEWKIGLSLEIEYTTVLSSY